MFYEGAKYYHNTRKMNAGNKISFNTTVPHNGTNDKSQPKIIAMNFY